MKRVSDRASIKNSITKAEVKFKFSPSFSLNKQSFHVKLSVTLSMNTSALYILNRLHDRKLNSHLNIFCFCFAH